MQIDREIERCGSMWILNVKLKETTSENILFNTKYLFANYIIHINYLKRKLI